MYSPFFTSGFLTTSSSPTTPTVEELGPRRGSLPTNSLSTTSTRTSNSPAEVDDASAYYFTLQPTRNTYEFRSFLSLDLADSQSLRSLVHSRRTPTSLRHSQSIPSLRRPSRDSMRSMPSPKPVPSSSLPSIPSASSSRASSIQQSIQPTPSVRAGNYAEALARLEGRAKDDFIILCDDEDDVDTEADIEMEPEDVVIPLSVLNGRSSTSSSRRTSKVSLCIHPYSAVSSRSSRKSRRTKRSSTKSSTPLSDHSASFIDLGANHPAHESHWNWRSFIDVGGI